MTYLERVTTIRLFYRELAKDQGKLVKHFILVSVGVHIFVALLVFLDPFNRVIEIPAPSEWQIEAELAYDLKKDAEKDSLSEAKAPENEALANGKLADEILVQKQILPQLPKTVDLQNPNDKSEVQETIPDELSKVKPPENTIESKKDENDEKKREAAVRLKKEEALERLLKEKARDMQKFANETSTPLSNALQQRKAQLAQGGGTDNEATDYALRVQRSVRKFYSIPETYRIRGESLTAQIRISVGPKGDILLVSVEKTSGEAGFDQLVIDIIHRAEPLPEPPKELIGKQLLLSFNP
jgi:TonB family protein